MAKTFFMHFFTSFVFILLCIPLFFAVPVINPQTLYVQFIEKLQANGCEIPSAVKLPFINFRPAENSADLSPYLKICNSKETAKEANVLCEEIFSILGNISCSYKGIDLPEIDFKISENVCIDIGSLHFSEFDIGNNLLRRLNDSIVCSMLCDGDFEQACQVLLWSFQVLHNINAVIESTKLKPSTVLKEAPSNGGVISGNTENGPEEEANNDEKKLIENPEKISSIPDSGKKLPSIQSTVSQPTDKAVSIKSLQVSDQNAGTNESASKPVQKATADQVAQQMPDKPPAQDQAAEQIEKMDESHSKKDNQAKKQQHTENLEDPHDESEVNFDAALPNRVENNEKKAPPPVSDAKPENKAPQPEIVIEYPSEVKHEKAHQKIESPLESTKDNTLNPAGSASSTKVEGKTPSGDKISSPIIDQKSTVKAEKTVLPTKPESKDVLITAEEATAAATGVPDGELLLPSVKAKENTKNKDKIPEEYNDLENNEDDAEYLKQDFEGGTNALPKPASNYPEENTKPRDPIYSKDDEFSSKNLFPVERNGIQMIAAFPDQEDSHFFFYFLSIVLILMGGYLLFHNKQKIIALIVEGRHERRRRSHGAAYKKLETK